MLCRSFIKHPDKLRPRTSVTDALLVQRYGVPTPGPFQATVAIICLGGGYSMTDVRDFCQRYSYPIPKIDEVSIDGATNQFTGNPNGPDGELALDIQRVIGFTRGRVGIRIYFCQNSGPSYAKAIMQVAVENICCAWTTSWGSDEAMWDANDRADLRKAAQACLQNGIPGFAASGDDGSSDGGPGNNVDFPASCPEIIACGGTSLITGVETAWSYGGGGLSRFYAVNPWQLITFAGRAVPDLAGNADPNSGFPTICGGQWSVVGGTSAVSPLMAASVACVVTLTGRRVLGLIAAVYETGLMQDIAVGSNGAFQAQIGPDCCTGMGTPTKGLWELVASLGSAPPAPPPTGGPVIQPPPPVAVKPAPITKDKLSAILQSYLHLIAGQATVGALRVILAEERFTQEELDDIYQRLLTQGVL